MIVLFVFFALILAAAGFGMAGLGVVMAVQGEVGAGLFGLVIGALILYGAYLFARVAWRTRRSIQTDTAPAQQGERRKRIHAVVASVLVLAASSVFMPVPAALRVIGVITALLALPVILARDFEPPKDRASRHN